MSWEQCPTLLRTCVYGHFPWLISNCGPAEPELLWIWRGKSGRLEFTCIVLYLQCVAAVWNLVSLTSLERSWNHQGHWFSLAWQCLAACQHHFRWTFSPPTLPLVLGLVSQSRSCWAWTSWSVFCTLCDFTGWNLGRGWHHVGFPAKWKELTAQASESLYMTQERNFWGWSSVVCDMRPLWDLLQVHYYFVIILWFFTHCKSLSV